MHVPSELNNFAQSLKAERRMLIKDLLLSTLASHENLYSLYLASQSWLHPPFSLLKIPNLFTLFPTNLFHLAQMEQKHQQPQHNKPNSDFNGAVLLHISNPNVYIWNTMIRGYCKALNPVMGILCFREMIREGVEMDERSFLFAMKGFDQVSGYREGGLVHCQIRKLGFSSSVLVQNGLISFYANGGFLNCARQVFDESSSRDVVTWTAMIDGFVQRNAPDEALKLFDLMVCSEVRPNEVTMITLLSACAVKGDLNLGRRIHSYIEKLDLQCTLNLMNTMLDMYVKCGCLTTAKCIFDKMDNRDVFSWTSIVNGYAKHGELELARKYFGEMPVKNVISWNAMISGYSQNNQPKEALDLFHDMLEGGVAPIEATLVCVLSACAQAGCFNLGQWIHNHYLHQKRVEFTVSLGNALIDMYAKCGRIDVAEDLFSDMPQRDLVSWNSMIVGHADHGSAKKALNLFGKMKDEAIKPDDITFIGVLSACSHAGLVNKGRELFGEMEQIFGLKPKIEHYVCIIDLLGRVGLVEEAYDMIKGMPMEPDEAAWGALLNACRMHGNADLGKVAADMLIDLDPEDSGTYVILANLCARERRWGDVSQVRSMMREKGIRKTPGRSCIEVDGKFFEFLASGDSHPQSEDVYRILDEIFALSKLEEDLAGSLKSINYFDNVNTLLVNG
ncbi:hypothetical protein Cgig2_026015 [Carnegiea gigantea]|uniref:Pentatricopeptide repeat-containing protein n=1 Tax=Carnegiea gigantea TaxID=171969 RepID=A0A9Q1KLN1_9CARY|nr:hypothetical protein Cgig2_026015 [Carnegiea gigantea]